MENKTKLEIKIKNHTENNKLTFYENKRVKMTIRFRHFITPILIVFEISRKRHFKILFVSQLFKKYKSEELSRK